MEEEVKNSNEKKTCKLFKENLGILLSAIAVALLIVFKIFVKFGVCSTIFSGIMSLAIYGLAVAGLVINSLGSKELSKQVWASLAILAILLFVL